MNFLVEILNFIYPTTCGICGKLGGNICENCKRNIENSAIFLNKIQRYSTKNIKYFDEHGYLFLYDGIIRKKIIEYKFNNKPYLSDFFYEFFVKNEKICRFLKNYDIIVPVPISNKRLKQRGYNQSELIAKKFNNIIKFEKDILIKIKDNDVQSLLNRELRRKNVKDVYEIKNVQKIQEKAIIIFDDIYTTGATVNECAKLLKKAGASKVGILTIAKD